MQMDPLRRLWPRADLRVGDADRQALIAELQRHYVEGRLTSEELGERVSAALAARTFGDLAELVADLPTLAVEPAEPASTAGQGGWRQSWPISVPPEVVLVAVILALVLVLVVLPMGRLGLFPFWPVLIWGVFFFGGASRRRF
jgi:hypothetical protein